MPHLSINVLGQFQITLDTLPLTRFESDKARALLIYLAIEADRPLRREHLIAMFWPEQSEQQGRKNLSQTLYRLRQAIQNEAAEPPFLLIDRHTIQFNLQSDARVDLHTFRHTVHAITATVASNGHAIEHESEQTPDTLTLQQQAVDLYRGPLLEQTLLVDSPEFEAWALLLRDELQALVLPLFDQLTALFEQQGDYDQALSYAQRLLALDPLRESSHRTLMRIFAQRGDRNAALRQYETCRKLLKNELKIPPEAATTELYKQIRSGALVVQPS